VALLAGRVHHKLDEEFPEITAAFLEAVAPHYLAPLPALSIARVLGKPEQPWAELPRATPLYTQPVKGHDLRCRFRTCYPVTLWPAVISAAELLLPGSAGFADGSGAAMALRLVVSCTHKRYSEVPPPEKLKPLLRIYLDGEQQYALYELLSSTARAYARLPGGALHELTLRPMGFAPDEGLLPYKSRVSEGYRTLQEYFAFPKMFLFFELGGLDARQLAGLGADLELLFPLARPAPRNLVLQPESFLLGCTPIVNLFSVLAEPISLTHLRAEYRVVPDVHRQSSMEIYAVDEVVASSPSRSEPARLSPLFSARVGALEDKSVALWSVSRREGPEGSELYLSIVDRALDPVRPAYDTLLPTVTCSNRDLPSRLPLGVGRRVLTRNSAACWDYDRDPPGDFTAGLTPGSAAVDRIDCLEHPTPSRRPALGKSMHWRLISHLALNHLPLTDGEAGLQALREILILYDFANPGAPRAEIDGLRSLQVRRTVGRPLPEPDTFCRGLELTIALAEDRFVGGSPYLFAAVLERFLGRFVSINSFTQLVAVFEQRHEVKRWPARAGDRILL
jgi:type VI secretion system protein ImpG